MQEPAGVAEDWMVHSDRRNALLALTAAGLLWGLTIPFSKLALGWLDPFTLTVARFALAAPLLALVARGSLRGALSWRVAGWGAVFYGLGVVLQNAAVERTSVTHAALIVATVPVFVALFAWMRGRSNSTPQAWAGFGLALAGVGLVAGTGGHNSLSGDALMLASAIAGAAYVVAQPRVLAGRNPVAVTAVQMAAGALFALPLSALPSPPPTSHALWGFVGLAVAGSLLPFALYAYGQARVVPEIAGAFVNLEPLVGATFGAFLFHDPFGPVQVAGVLALLVGLMLSVAPQRALRLPLPLPRPSQ
jgi:drug/metabolite transporter (DMT)-like permease